MFISVLSATLPGSYMVLRNALSTHLRGNDPFAIIIRTCYIYCLNARYFAYIISYNFQIIMTYFSYMTSRKLKLRRFGGVNHVF